MPVTVSIADSDELVRVLEEMLGEFENILVHEWATNANPHPEKTDETCQAARAILKKVKGYNNEPNHD